MINATKPLLSIGLEINTNKYHAIVIQEDAIIQSDLKLVFKK